MKTYEFNTHTPKDNLTTMQMELEEEKTVDHTPREKERINKLLGYIAFELGMRERVPHE